MRPNRGERVTSRHDAPKKPDAVVVIPSIEDPRRAVAFAAREHEVLPAIVSFPPVAENVLRYRV
jgi:hypothetical protein